MLFLNQFSLPHSLNNPSIIVPDVFIGKRVLSASYRRAIGVLGSILPRVARTHRASQPTRNGIISVLYQQGSVIILLDPNDLCTPVNFMLAILFFYTF